MDKGIIQISIRARIKKSTSAKGLAWFMVLFLEKNCAGYHECDILLPEIQETGWIITQIKGGRY